MNLSREEVLFELAIGKPAGRSGLDRFQVRLDAVLKRRPHPPDLLHPFTHPVPLDLKTIAVMNDMTEAAERSELTRQSIVEECRQWRLVRRAEPLEKVQMPVF